MREKKHREGGRKGGTEKYENIDQKRAGRRRDTIERRRGKGRRERKKKVG